MALFGRAYKSRLTGAHAIAVQTVRTRAIVLAYVPGFGRETNAIASLLAPAGTSERVGAGQRIS
jgi:hypothetical protein